MAARSAGTLLYGVSSRDPVSYLGAAAFVLIVAATACLVPALRAARLKPPTAYCLLPTAYRLLPTAYYRTDRSTPSTPSTDFSDFITFSRCFRSLISTVMSMRPR